MTLTPPSSIFGGIVGPIAVTGPMTDAEFAAHLPLTVNATQGSVPWFVDATNLGLLDIRLSTIADELLPLATEATLAALAAATATEATLARAADSLDDVALTAILEREKVPA